MVLPYINMNLPRVYTCSPSWTPLPPPSPYHPSGSSQCTSPEHPVSCIEPGLAIRFTYDRIIALQNFVCFCQTSTWIRHGCARVPHPEPPSYLPPHTILLGHPSAPAPSILYPASNLDWWFISYMILYMFQCHSPKSSHPRPLPQSPKDCSIHLCLFCCLAYRVIVTIFLNSIYMH